jgi:hypothetical protein
MDYSPTMMDCSPRSQTFSRFSRSPAVTHPGPTYGFPFGVGWVRCSSREVRRSYGRRSDEPAQVTEREHGRERVPSAERPPAAATDLW